MTITSYSRLAVRCLELVFFRMMESLASPPIRGPVPSMTISILTSLSVGDGYKVGLEPKRLAVSTAMRSSSEPDGHEQIVKRNGSCYILLCQCQNQNFTLAVLCSSASPICSFYIDYHSRLIQSDTTINFKYLWQYNKFNIHFNGMRWLDSFDWFPIDCYQLNCSGSGKII